MLNRVEYEAALRGLVKPEWRIAVKQINQYLLKEGVFPRQTDINNWIDRASKEETATKDKILGSSTYKKFINDKLYAASQTQIDAPKSRDNAIRYLLLFYDEKKVWLACENGALVRIRQDKNLLFEPQGPNHDDSVVYDVFYWRTTRDEVGIAKLRFYDDWNKADLVYHYLTTGKGKEQASMTGTVHPRRENIYINFADTHVPKGAFPIHSFWSLYVSADTDKRDYIAGVFASTNRDNNEPVCGKLILKRTTGNRDLSQSEFIAPPPPGGSERVLQNIPDDIYYILTNTRLRVSNNPILGERTLPFHNEVVSLQAFAGTYQVYQPWRNAKLNLTKLTISKKGRVVLTSNNNNQDTIGFVVYCDKTLIIRFAYDVEADYHRFYSMLETVPGSRNLTGIHAGLTEGKELVSGRVYLSWREPDDEIQIKAIRTPPRSYFDKLYHTDPDAVDFLTNQEPGSVDTRWMRHLDGLSDPHPKLDLTPPPAYLKGSYNAFFLTKIEQSPQQNDLDNRTLLPEQPIQLIQMPVFINGDQVVLKDGDRTVEGEIYYDGVNGLMMCFREFRFWSSLVLSIPKPGTREATKQVYYNGILTRTIEEPEASALILHRETDPDRLTYQCVESLSELMEIEAHYRGLVSFLFGDWGRFVRMTGYKKYIDKGFSTKYETFRRTFFAAACYHGARNEVPLCLDNLERAYRHGFGAFYYKNMDANQDNFPEDLQQERQMLRNELGEIGSFRDEQIKSWINERWKLGEYL